MHYTISIEKELLKKALAAQETSCLFPDDTAPISDFARALQESLFEQSGIFLTDAELIIQEQKVLASKKRVFDFCPPKSSNDSSSTTLNPIPRLLNSLMSTHGIRVSLNASEHEPQSTLPIWPALKQKIDVLRNTLELGIIDTDDHNLFIKQDGKIYFTRHMMAYQSDGQYTRHLNDWANILIVEHTVSKTKKAFAYDSQGGLNDSVFMYGALNQKIICSGIVKIVPHKVNEAVTVPRLLFSPNACATNARKDAYNHEFMLYAISLSAPLNLGFLSNPNAIDFETGYVYGGFSNEAVGEKTDLKYDAVIKAIQEEQQEAFCKNVLGA